MTRRSEAEADETLVQFVAVGALTYAGRVFVFDRSADPHRRTAYGRRTILRLCHVDQGDGLDVVGAARTCLIHRLRQDLHLELQIEPRPLGAVWHDDRSGAHMGLVFEVPILDELVAESLKEKEFNARGRGHKMTSTFGNPALILEHAADLELEPWSKDILADGWIR